MDLRAEEEVPLQRAQPSEEREEEGSYIFSL